MKKRISLEQKITNFLKEKSLLLSLDNWKYTVRCTDIKHIYIVAKSKSISRAISELYKYYNETK